MTKKHFQFTLEQRYQIEALKDAGNNQSCISIIVGFTKSTISREFKEILPCEDLDLKCMLLLDLKKKDLRKHPV